MQHKMGELCDCQICGWHVRDIEPLTAADEWVTFDSGCLERRPRADQHRESPRGRRRGELPVEGREHVRRASDAGRRGVARELASEARFEAAGEGGQI